VLSCFKKPAPGLSKGKTLMAEMMSAKDNAGRIKITAGLYLISRNKSGTEVMKKVMLLKSLKCAGGLKMQQVPQVYFSSKFDETTQIYDALGDILVDAQEFHRKSFPLAKLIQRFVLFVVMNIITILVCVSGVSSTFMLMKALRNIIVSLTIWLLMVKFRTSTKREDSELLWTYPGTVGAFFEKFKDQGYISKTAAEGKQIEIRIVCEEDRLVRIHQLQCYQN
jgi:hypothetical protein